ncbi:hypothetical protein FHS29_001568 [Saccharothrix tamanrassetensis]|uniref:Transposase n=1 Tax=Saccharothrix tamanrassetensis TaxID=1051531 RepID=A0A841CFN9_9PSEU|nr:hypothetical protein [Saccharothrix tamanrassetensis]
MKLHADKSHNVERLRHWLRHRGIIPHIARKGIDCTDRLGRHRGVVERTISWLTGYRRLTIRYVHHDDNHCGSLTLARALTCFKRPANWPRQT